MLWIYWILKRILKTNPEHRIYLFKQTYNKKRSLPEVVEDEKSVRICTFLDSNRYVYHDAASEPGVGRYNNNPAPSAQLPTVLLLN